MGERFQPPKGTKTAKPDRTFLQKETKGTKNFHHEWISVCGLPRGTALRGQIPLAVED